MTLTDFLLARVLELEAEAKTVIPDPWPNTVRALKNELNDLDLIADPRWLLAECEAKRRIIELHSSEHECTFGPTMTDGGFVQDGEVCPTLRLLALPYADHPEYRDEWRPA